MLVLVLVVIVGFAVGFAAGLQYGARSSRKATTEVATTAIVSAMRWHLLQAYTWRNKPTSLDTHEAEQGHVSLAIQCRDALAPFIGAKKAAELLAAANAWAKRKIGPPPDAES